MNKVDYLKLSEQYASFLVAVGGVSITVLTLVLSLGSETAKWTEGDPRLFLVAALIVATVSCFTGAHMMAETAAFISFSKEATSNAFKCKASGERLFILASFNIFIAIILVLFALMILPTASGKVDANSITVISFTAFGLIGSGAIYWMILAIKYRMNIRPMNIRQIRRAILSAIVIGIIWSLYLYFCLVSKKWLLLLTFLPIVSFTVISLIYFALIFKGSAKARLRKARILDICIYSFGIIISYLSLLAAGIRMMLSN